MIKLCDSTELSILKSSRGDPFVISIFDIDVFRSKRSLELSMFGMQTLPERSLKKVWAMWNLFSVVVLLFLLREFDTGLGEWILGRNLLFGERSYTVDSGIMVPKLYD